MTKYNFYSKTTSDEFGHFVKWTCLQNFCFSFYQHIFLLQNDKIDKNK